MASTDSALVLKVLAFTDLQTKVRSSKLKLYREKRGISMAQLSAWCGVD